MLWALSFVLVIDAVTLAASGMVDITAYGNPQIPWAFLRIIVAFVNLAAAVEVLRVIRLNTAIRRMPWEFPTVLIGQASVIPMFIVPIMMEVESLAHDSIDIFLTAIFASLLAVAIGISFGALVARPEYLQSSWAIFIALLPLASLFQFWYQTFYLPTHERPTVNVEADLEEVRRQGAVSQMRGTVTMENVGKATLSTLGSIYAVTGHSMDTEKPMVRDDVRNALEGNRVPWMDGIPHKGVLKVGRLVRPGGHLTPSQKNSTSFVFDVHNEAQQKLRLIVQLSLLVHSGDLDVNPCLKDHEYDPDLPSCLEAAIPASNMFRDILGDRPLARTIVTFSSSAPPKLLTRFQISDWDPKDKRRKRRGAGAAQEINPFLVSRGVTMSSEYRLDP
ncbi:hypothetical protein [Streptomyces coeruleorubidus]|uniref:hypothetical protein n=1 Tax=Streptomyces coeruleorubidus TaxID=116188 RepID=UPI0018761469|nr:hypothetical protein [Streptomyces bellus]GGT88868.1 hypothetical protein GCM10010244_12330 [Streptomyces bellus]